MQREKELKLKDLIDLKSLQEFQDNFAKAMNIASIIVDKNGPLTEPSNFSEFCSEYIRKTPLGVQRCNKCDIEGGNNAVKSGKPFIYNCHAGLTDFAVPIIVEGQHVGSILGGQILSEKPNEDFFKKLAKELDINEEFFLKTTKQLKILPKDTIQNTANMLESFAKAIAHIGLKNLKLDKTQEKEQIYTRAMEAIRNTIDIDELKKIIVNIIGQALNADRCFIVEYDQKTDQFMKAKEQYLSPTGSEKYTGLNINEDFPNFFNLLRQGKPIIANREEFISDCEGPDFDIEKETIRKYGITNIFVAPLFYKKELLGVLSTHYEDETRKVNKEEIQMVTTIANHIAIAIHQAKLYRLTKLQAEREKINRNIIEIIRSTMDKEDIKSLFVKTIGEHFGADVVFFSDFNPETNMYEMISGNCEYISDDYILSNIDSKVNSSQNITTENKSKGLENKLPDELKSLIEAFGAKSDYNFPVLYQGRTLGFFYIGFTKKEHRLNDDDLDLIKNISTQAAIGLYQAELYLKAQESSFEKGNFIANMSHEIKTPLNIIIGFSELLSSSEIDRKKQVKYLKSINQSGKYLLSLTNDILNLSKFDSGKFEVVHEDIDSHKLIQEVSHSVNIIADNKNINISIDTIPAKITADKKMFTQILYNLLNNAIKFTPEKGDVKIKSELNKDKLVISVQDTGIGIDKKDKEKIFEAFKQVDSSYPTHQEGVGLGLAITKKLVELHNGSIHLESTKGKGSKFWVELPTRRQKTPQASKL